MVFAPIAEAVATLLKPHAEVVIHDLRTQTIAYIANNLADAQSQMVVTQFAPPGSPVLTLVGAEELAERRHLRVTQGR